MTMHFYCIFSVIEIQSKAVDDGSKNLFGHNVGTTESV